MDEKNLMSALVSIVVSFIPIGLLIWKASGLAAQIVQNKKDIDSVADGVRDENKKFDERFDEFGARLEAIGASVARIEGVLSSRRKR